MYLPSIYEAVDFSVDIIGSLYESLDNLHWMKFSISDFPGQLYRRLKKDITFDCRAKIRKYSFNE